MSEDRRRRRERSRTSAEGASFMDVAPEAFVRFVALEKWREIVRLRDARGLDTPAAVAEAGRFPARGAYATLWADAWRRLVVPAATDADAGAIFAAIERAVAQAVADERRERRTRGDRPFDEDPEYRGFIDGALARVARQTADGLEAG